MKVVVAALGLLMQLAGCASAPESEPSVALVSDFPTRLQRAHRTADELPAAQAEPVLLEVLQQPPPADWQAADRRWVVQDVRFRLAVLALQTDRPQVALEHVEQGLKAGEGEDLATANLWIARGQAHEVLKSAAQASEAYAQAQRIHSVLLENTLKESP